MDRLPFPDDERIARLSFIEDDIRRRLWSRAVADNGPSFDRMVEELARDQYVSESQLR